MTPTTTSSDEPPQHADPASLISALFPHAAAEVQQQQQQVENDFMFALFIQEKEQAASSAPNPDPHSPVVPAAAVAVTVRHVSGVPAPVPVPDPTDPDVGHFCAPFCPGFCEANFCIFHAPAAEGVRVPTQDRQGQNK